VSMYLCRCCTKLSLWEAHITSHKSFQAKLSAFC
jgi:hypothetical protein